MDNRISQLSTSASLDRSAVKSDFGAMLARGLQAGVGMASGIIPGGAIISAAVNQTAGRALAGSTHAVVGGGGGGGSTGTVRGGETAPATPGDAYSGMADTIKMQEQSNAQYMKLQNDMQQESREYNTISNILKVRHESAKTAINNIR